jgi:hypothetical protein
LLTLAYGQALAVWWAFELNSENLPKIMPS